MNSEQSAQIAVNLYMDAISKKTKAEWLDLFADDASVEDPVGPSPNDPSGQGYQGKIAISTFWDKFIAPNSLTYSIIKSYDTGNEIANVGAVSITYSNGDSTDYEGVFVYKVNEVGKIISLRAFWEYDSLVVNTRSGSQVQSHQSSITSTADKCEEELEVIHPHGFPMIINRFPGKTERHDS